HGHEDHARGGDGGVRDAGRGRTAGRVGSRVAWHWVRQKAEEGAVVVLVKAHDLPAVIDPRGLGEGGVGGVESRVLAAAQQETAGVWGAVGGEDLAGVVDPVGNGGGGVGVGVGGENRVLAAAQQKTMEVEEVGVEVQSHNLARGVDPVGHGEERVGGVNSRV